MRKRLLSIVLVLALCLAYVPVQVFAVDIGSVAEFEAFAPTDGDVIVLTDDIYDPNYILDLDSLTSGSSFTIDLNGYNLTLDTIKIAEAGLTITSSVPNNGTLTFDFIYHDGQYGIFELYDGVTVTCTNTFDWVSDDGIGVYDGSTLNLEDQAVLDYISDTSTFGVFFSGDSKVVLNADRVRPNDATHAATVAALLTSIPAQFEISGDTFSGDITFRRNLPDGSSEVYTDKITMIGGTYPQATVTAATTSRVYNHSEQDLVTLTSTGGTPWYYYSGAWTTTVPTATDVTQLTGAGYMIVGDGEHANSTQVTGATFEITPFNEVFDVTITGHTGNYTYNGNERTVSGYDIDIPAGVPLTEDDLIVPATTPSVSGTDAGTYNLTLNPTDFNISNLNVTGASLVLNDGQLNISKLDVNVTVTGHTLTSTYDQTTKTVSGYDVTSDSTLFDIAYDNYEYIGPDTTISESQGGTYPMDLDASYFTAGTNANFNPTFHVTPGYLVIDPLPVTLTAQNETIQVNDPMPTFTVTAEGILPGDESQVTYTATTTATDTSAAGTWPITVASSTSSTNYTITPVNGTLTIGSAVASWTVEPTEKTGMIYTGTDQELIDEGTVPAGCTAQYSLDDTTWNAAIPTATDAGTYTVYYKIVGDGVNYTDSAVGGPLSVTIGRANVTIDANNLDKYYGQPDPTLTATVNGLIGTDTVAYDVTRIAGEDVGTYVISVDYTPNQGNYQIISFTPGTFTIMAAEATWTSAPTARTGLTYNGTVQTLANAGTVPAGCTALYSLDDVTYNATLPTSTNAGDYEVYYRIQGGGNYTDSGTNSFVVQIEQATVTVRASNFTINVGDAAPDFTAPLEGTHYTVTGLIDPDEVTGAPTMDCPGLDVNTAGNYVITIDTAGMTLPSLNYMFGAAQNGTLTVAVAGGSSKDPDSYDFTKPKDGIGSYTGTDESWTWGERANLPKDVADFYKVLVENSVLPGEQTPSIPGGGSGHAISNFLATDDIWVLPAEDPQVEKEYPVDTAMACLDHEPTYLDNGDGKVDETTFGNSNFFIVGVGTGDTKVDYPNLKTGDVITNKTFNGIYITKVQKSSNPTFDADLAKLKNDTIASFRAFELDHPEIFWLNGSIKLRVLTVTISGVQTSYLFMTLVDDSGFTMRIDNYAAAGSIEAAIKQRDAAVATILAQVPADATPRQKIANLNKWFTLHNEYNRSADLGSIGYTPHRSLKSLVGNEGVNGPVCDGYSRGFKVICDKLGIPCILDTGVAIMNASHSEYHMWNRIQIDGVWYGMDVTWDDPVAAGKYGIISGYETEKFMLVGNDTVIDGYKFGVSHPSDKTAGGTTGVLFASLMVNVDSIEGYAAMPFQDVGLGDWYYDYVKAAFGKQLMGGTSENLFSPKGTATRGQIVQILYNIAGQPEVDEVKVDGWFGKPATWAMEKGIVAGYADGEFHGDDPVTREQLATILWAFEGAPEQSGTLAFADADKVSSYAVNALLWAKAEGIIGGKPGNLVDPQGTATRAEIATIFSNYMK